MVRRSVNGRMTNTAPATQPNGSLLAFPFWPFFIFPLIMPLLWWASLRTRRKHRWLVRGQCIGCGFDLRASIDRCPECGMPIVRLPLITPQSETESIVIHVRARPALRLYLQVSFWMLLLMLAVVALVKLVEWFHPPEPGTALTWPLAAGMTLSVPTGMFILGCLASLGNLRHRWIVGAPGVDIYEPGSPPCHVRWRSIGDTFYNSWSLLINDNTGKLIDVMHNVNPGDAVALNRLWEKHRMAAGLLDAADRGINA